ncbi:PmoA family protein [Pseudonocardia nigra]|uniref:DUF6807 domain-containing protein n=1 Tax=Pseudonocardia nigra TaxID=1921578 RepID=UPI001C5EE8D6|nr:PmoA family protein [Pseudonocardia nigra]
MGDGLLATLHVGGVAVADYTDGSGLDATLSPRPHLHPVRTLAGRVVTDAVPEDHRWHLGVSVALQDVGGGNFWGGRTYVRDQGYTWRADHGRVEHAGFEEMSDAGWTERLRWVAADGQQILAEHRCVTARPADGGWELELRTTLASQVDRPLPLGSPATNGRTGAGYGGLFWRLPAADTPEVCTAEAESESAVHGSVAPWLLWVERGPDPFAVAFTGADDATRADPWFVRVEGYPGVGSQLAATDPVVLPAGGSVTRGLRALIVDGALDAAAAARWAARG